VVVQRLQRAAAALFGPDQKALHHIGLVVDGDREFLEAVFGETMPRAYVTIANWNKGKSVWVTDHWYIRTVYAWMPLPAPPTEASDE
jgi:hypothetical protein